MSGLTARNGRPAYHPPVPRAPATTARDSDDTRDEAAADRAAARQGIQSVEIAMQVLNALEEGAGPMSLSQISALSGMQPSKTHRYLVSLVRIGLASQSPTSTLYNLGPAMRRLGAEALRRMDEVGLTSELLPGLRDRTRHAVNLSVWGDNGPVIVRWEYGSFALPITVRVGATLPLLTSSAGRVFLAYLPSSLTTPVVRAQQAPSKDARWTDEQLTEAKDETRRNGYAFTSGAILPGITSLSAPVFTAGDVLPLVVTVALPTPQATTAVLRSITQQLLDTTEGMSAELGHVTGRED